jgi:hypothetical protein
MSKDPDAAVAAPRAVLRRSEPDETSALEPVMTSTSPPEPILVLPAATYTAPPPLCAAADAYRAWEAPATMLAVPPRPRNVDVLLPDWSTKSPPSDPGADVLPATRPTLPPSPRADAPVAIMTSPAEPSAEAPVEMVMSPDGLAPSLLPVRREMLPE